MSEILKLIQDLNLSLGGGELVVVFVLVMLNRWLFRPLVRAASRLEEHASEVLKARSQTSGSLDVIATVRLKEMSESLTEIQCTLKSLSQTYSRERWAEKKESRGEIPR